MTLLKILIFRRVEDVNVGDIGIGDEESDDDQIASSV